MDVSHTLGLIPTATMRCRRLPQAAAGEDAVREVRAALVAAGLLRHTEV
jgi:hypothetical protein